MTKWEYIILECNSSLRVEYVNGELIKKIEDGNVDLVGGKGEIQPYLYKYLPILGKQGWEVCGTSPFSTRINGEIVSVQIILKRPLEK